MSLRNNAIRLSATVPSWLALLCLSSMTMAAEIVTLNFDLFTNSSSVVQFGPVTIDLNADHYEWSYELDVLDVSSNLVPLVSLLPPTTENSGLAGTLPFTALDLDFDLTATRLRLIVDPTGAVAATLTNVSLPQVVVGIIPATIQSYRAVGSFTVIAAPEPESRSLAMMAFVAVGVWIRCRHRKRSPLAMT